MTIDPAREPLSPPDTGGLGVHLREPANLKRALRTALLVGPILTLINQTNVVSGLLRGNAPRGAVWIRIALTFIVPFVVSLVSSALADRKREASSNSEPQGVHTDRR